LCNYSLRKRKRFWKSLYLSIRLVTFYRSKEVEDGYLGKGGARTGWVRTFYFFKTCIYNLADFWIARRSAMHIWWFNYSGRKCHCTDEIPICKETCRRYGTRRRTYRPHQLQWERYPNTNSRLIRHKCQKSGSDWPTVKAKPTSRCCSFGHSSRSLLVEVAYQTKGLIMCYYHYDSSLPVTLRDSTLC
jgi:hypothetical protein